MTVAGWKFQIIPLQAMGMLMVDLAWIDREAARLLGIPASVLANLCTYPDRARRVGQRIYGF